MTTFDALRAGLRTLSSYPAAIAPYYLLSVGATMISRTPLTIGIGLAVIVLRAQGRIEPVVQVFERLEPAAGARSLTQAQQETLMGLITPTVVVVTVLSALATAVLYVLCRGVASAGTIHAVFAPLDDRKALSAGAVGISRDWRSFVAIAIARAIVYVGAGVGLTLGIGLSATGIGIIVGLPLVLVSVAGLLVGHLLLAFAGQAVVVGGESALDAIGDSVRFPLRAPTAFVLYVSLALTATIVLVIVALLAQFVGVSRVVGLLVALVIGPVLDAAKTGLYAGDTGVLEAGSRGSSGAPSGHSNPATDGGQPNEGDDDTSDHEDEQTSHRDEQTDHEDDSAIDVGQARPAEGTQKMHDDGLARRVSSRLLAGQRRGLAAVARFLRTNPLANLAGLGLFLLGTGLGWLLTGPYGVRLDAPREVAGVFGEFAVGPFVNIAANNWQVAVGQGFGGVAFGVPTVENLLFNGVLVGGLAGLFDRTVFLALVAPHGIVEIPALAVSGGVGLYLGGVGYRWVRGRIDAPTVGDRLQRATWVLVGLLPVFVLAGFIEAFLTPRIAMLVLG